MIGINSTKHCCLIKSEYSELYLKIIINGDYIHGQKLFEEFRLKNLGEYHDLYLRSDVPLLAVVFESFRKMYLEIFELDPTKFFSDSLIRMTSSFKRDRCRIRSIN